MAEPQFRNVVFQLCFEKPRRVFGRVARGKAEPLT